MKTLAALFCVSLLGLPATSCDEDRAVPGDEAAQGTTEILPAPQQNMIEMVAAGLIYDPMTPGCIQARYRRSLAALFGWHCEIPEEIRASPEEQLYFAGERGDVEMATRLLDEQPELVHSSYKWGFTALHGAASEGHITMARLLLDKGATIDPPNDDGVTPLHLARDAPMIALLAERGADLDRAAGDGSTPLIMRAAEQDGLEAIEALLALGADPDRRDSAGRTAADIARVRGELTYLQALRGDQRQRSQ